MFKVSEGVSACVCQTIEVESERLELKAEMDSVAKERLENMETINRLTNSLKVSRHRVSRRTSISLCCCPYPSQTCISVFHCS